MCSNGACVPTCTTGLTTCGSACVNTATDATNCGACGTTCRDVANASAACRAAACTFTCDADFRDCNSSSGDGCEVNVTTSTTNCGGCGQACGAVTNGTAACVAGACRVGSCSGAFRDCNGTINDGCEVDTSTSTAHCGACNRACAAGQVCAAGVCTTSVGFEQSFTQGQTSPHCRAWNTFRAGLTGSYSTITIFGSRNPSGVTCTGTAANTLCQALRTGTDTSVSCGGRTWRVGTCGAENTSGVNVPAIELNATGDMCSCPTGTNTAIVRPCIDVYITNPNWGGLQSDTCTGPTQTLGVRCQ